MVLAIAVLVLAWLGVMFFRMELRAQWWAYQLTQVESQQDRNYYLTRLAAISDKSLGAVDRLLGDPRDEIRKMGVTVLVRCKSLRARQRLLTMLTDESGEVWAQASLGLASRPDAAELIPVMSQLLRGEDIQSARAAAFTLERMGGPQAEEILLDSLRTATDPDLSAQLIDSLGILRCQSAVPLLKDLLGDDQPVAALPANYASVQRAVAALGEDLSTRGINPQELLEATQVEMTVASFAARSLHLITGETYGK